MAACVGEGWEVWKALHFFDFLKRSGWRRLSLSYCSGIICVKALRFGILGRPGTMATISEVFAIAVQHHQAGRLDEAERIYRQILSVAPENAGALHLLGVVASQSGRHGVAV